MPFSDVYRRQVQLLVRTLPLVAEEDCFALKGGTAINLFHRNLPRLSVDIDLTYLPLADRPDSLAGIDAALKHIGERIRASDSRIRVQESGPGSPPCPRISRRATPWRKPTSNGGISCRRTATKCPHQRRKSLPC